ncbi:MAG: hypothetical protein JXB04_02110 [Kiritimatiellae bacterium]|nr:hypothetical protein [Kiritimatiellia bacterium]
MSTTARPEEFASRGGFFLPPWSWSLLFAVLLVFLAWSGVHRSPYHVAGDPVLYLAQARLLGRQYFPQNARALMADWKGKTDRAADEKHIRLKTEAGFPLLLLATFPIGPEAPFLLNGFLVAVLLASVMMVAWSLDGNRQRGALAALLALSALLLFPEAAWRVWLFVKPFRDTPAHMFGMLALFLAIVSTRGRRPGLLAFFSGMLIGLAAWCRLPNGLFVVPAGLAILLLGKRRFPERFRVGLCLGAGLILCLAPVFLQNVFEGKSFFNVPQAGALMRARRYAGQVQDNWKGLHPLNFRFFFVPSLRVVMKAFPVWAWVALAAGAVASIARAWRQMVVILSGAAAFLLLYSCYDKVVARYLAVTVFFMALLLAVALSHLVYALVSRLPRKATRAWLSVCFALILGLAITTTAFPDRESMRMRTFAHTDMLRFRDWLASEFKPTDVFIANDPDIRTWIDHFSDTRRKRIRWNYNTGDRRGQEWLDRYLAEGRRAYFISHLHRDGRERQSWWKNDMSHFYDITPSGKEILFDGSAYRGLVMYEVRRRESLERTVRPERTDAAGRWLFFYSAMLTTSNRWQEAVLSSPAFSQRIPVRLQAGPNLVRLPCRVSGSHAVFTLESDTPLPALPAVQLLEKGPARIDLGNYAAAGTHAVMLSNASVHWKGYRYWYRDWGDDATGNHGSYPRFLLTEGSAVRMPRPDADLLVRLYFSARGEKTRHAIEKDALPPVVTNLAYRFDQNILQPVVIMLPPVGERDPEVGADFVHELVLPRSVLRRAESTDLELIATHPERGLPELILRQVEFCPGCARPGAAPREAGAGPRLAESWHEPGVPTPGWGEDGAWLAPTFRILDGKVSVTAEAARPADARAVCLSFYLPEEAPAASLNLSLRVDGRKSRHTLTPSDTPATIVIPIEPGRDRVDIEIVPNPVPRASPLPVLRFASVLHTPEASAPLIISDDGRAGPLCTLRDFWTAEEQEDNTVCRWTRANSHVDVPMIGPFKDMALSLRIRALPAPAGEQQLRLLVNGHDAGTFRVEPGTPQEHHVSVDSAWLTDGINTFTIESTTWSIAEVLGTGDNRQVGVFLESMQLRRTSP